MWLWFHKLSSPPHAYRTAERLRPWLFWPAVVLLLQVWAAPPQEALYGLALPAPFVAVALLMAALCLWVAIRFPSARAAFHPGDGGPRGPARGARRARPPQRAPHRPGEVVLPPQHEPPHVPRLRDPPHERPRLPAPAGEVVEGDERGEGAAEQQRPRPHPERQHQAGAQRLSEQRPRDRHHDDGVLDPVDAVDRARVRRPGRRDRPRYIRHGNR